MRVLGIDAHGRSRTAVALEAGSGELCGEPTVAADARGHVRPLARARSRSAKRRFALEVARAALREPAPPEARPAGPERELRPLVDRARWRLCLEAAPEELPASVQVRLARELTPCCRALTREIDALGRELPSSPGPRRRPSPRLRPAPPRRHPDPPPRVRPRLHRPQARRGQEHRRGAALPQAAPDAHRLQASTLGRGPARGYA